MPARAPNLSPLARELHKRRPFESPEQEATLNLLRTAEHLAGDFESLFKARGLSGATYNVLRILRGSGAEGRPCHEIGEHMVARVPDVTRLVDRLESGGLVERRRIARDRRVVMIHITPKGLRLLGDLDGPVADLHARQLGHLSRAELAELSRLLVKARRTDPEPA